MQTALEGCAALNPPCYEFEFFVDGPCTRNELDGGRMMIQNYQMVVVVQQDIEETHRRNELGYRANLWLTGQRRRMKVSGNIGQTYLERRGLSKLPDGDRGEGR